MVIILIYTLRRRWMRRNRCWICHWSIRSSQSKLLLYVKLKRMLLILIKKLKKS